MDIKQSATNRGLSVFFSFFRVGGGGGLNCLVVFPTHFNPNNSLLMILHNTRLLSEHLIVA